MFLNQYMVLCIHMDGKFFSLGGVWIRVFNMIMCLDGSGLRESHGAQMKD